MLRPSLPTALQGLLGAVMLLAPKAAACQGPGGLSAALDSIVRVPVEGRAVAGLAVGVIKGRDTLLLAGYGFSDLEHRVPATAESVFRIGSLTKQFTAAAVMQLAEQGKLSLEDEVSKFVPEFPTGGHRVTVRHLLNHTSGIQRGYTVLRAKGDASMRRQFPHDVVLGFARDDPFEFAPGTDWRYSNAGYFLLGTIIEKVSGKGYSAYLQEHIFTPLGLNSTTVCDQKPVIPNRAEGYIREDGQFFNAPPIDMSLVGAAGAICSSLRDVLRWQAALEGGRVVGGGAYRQMISPDTLANGKRIAYGLGLMVGELEGRPRIAHSGSINGFATYHSRYPKDSLTITVLMNTGDIHNHLLEQRIARRVLGLPHLKVRDLPLSAALRARYTGEYTGPGVQLTIWEEGERLRASALGRIFDLRFQGDHRFVSPLDPEIGITFQVTKGTAKSATLDWVGRPIEVIRVQERSQ